MSTFSGTFKTLYNDVVRVEIKTADGSNASYKIYSGDEDSYEKHDIYFTADPVTISTKVSDTMETLICKSCTINLMVKHFVGAELFTNTSRNAPVTIYKNNICIFYGFIEPQSFDQDYSQIYDQYTINCIDALSTLQYYNYDNVYAENYRSKKENAGNITIKDALVNKIMYGLLKEGAAVYYDSSKAVHGRNADTLFTDTGVSELVFLGDDPDGVMKCDKAAEDLLKYFSLHIIQHGKNFFIFNWDTIRQTGMSKVFTDIITGSTEVVNMPIVDISSNFYMSDNTSLSIGDVYSQIKLKCDVDAQSTMIENPLSDEDITSLYSGRQLYMTEYFTEGSGDSARNAIVDMLHNRGTGYEQSTEIDWYIRIMSHPNWKFYTNGLDSQTIDNYIINTLNNKDQYKVAQYLRNNPAVGSLIQLGSVKKTANDNKLVSSIDMKDYIYISVNGNAMGYHATNFGTALPSETDLQNHTPVAVYNGNIAGGTYSPVDDKTTNYLVFSGKMLLQPLVFESTTDVAEHGTEIWKNLAENDFNVKKTEGASAVMPSYSYDPGYWNFANLAKSDNNSEGRYYVRQFYPGSDPHTEINTSKLNYTSAGIQPPMEDKKAGGMQYNYNHGGDYNSDGITGDHITKIPILDCILKIGDKYCVETKMDQEGYDSKFEWLTEDEIKSRSDLKATDEDGNVYYKNYISLGINPSPGDNIVGTEFDIQNTVSYTQNIDAEGTAIPIKRDDALSGKIEFQILGPVNMSWNNVIRRHPTAFRHTKYYDNWMLVMPWVENIILTDFKCKLLSDNGHQTAPNKDKDLVYISNVTSDYANIKSMDFKFVSQLTADECYEKELSTGSWLNAILDMNNNLALTKLDNKITGENNYNAEEFCVDEYYREYSKPKIQMTTDFKDNVVLPFDSEIPQFMRFHSPSLRKDFFVLENEDNLITNTSRVTLKEL